MAGSEFEDQIPSEDEGALEAPNPDLNPVQYQRLLRDLTEAVQSSLTEAGTDEAVGDSRDAFFSALQRSDKSVTIERKSWQGDTAGCSICRSVFGEVLNRRHHCRMCGKCVCHDCSPNLLQLKGNLHRTCTYCVLNGAGAFELLAPLQLLRKELCSFSISTSDFASLPAATHPAQGVAACVAAVGPLRKSFLALPAQAARAVEMETKQFRMQISSAEAALSEERQMRMEAEAQLVQERRMRMDAEEQLVQERRMRKDAEEQLVQERGMRMEAEEQLVQERRESKELEGKVAELMGGLCQLNRMLKDLEENKVDDVGFYKGSDTVPGPKGEATPQEMLASCKLSAANLLDRRGWHGLSSQVPVLSSTLGCSTRVPSESSDQHFASETTDPNVSSESSDSEETF